jgi:glycosyltransferase involved in cell wall biosynthesis
MMAVNIANSLFASDIDSFLCATRFEGDLKSKLNKDVGYLFLNRKRKLDFKAVFRLKKFIVKNEIAIIHAHSSSFVVASLVKLFYSKVAIVWHDHYGNSEELDQRKKQPLKLFSKYFKEIIVVNNLLKNWSVNVLNHNKVHYLSNFATFINSKHINILNGNNEKRLVCVAGFRPQKDHLTLLKAFKIINQSYNEWSLHLIGNHYNDAYFTLIINYIKDNKLDKVVFLYHGTTNIESILAESTIGVLSSKSEGLPVSLLEYGMAKLPVIVTDVGECKNVVLNDDFGYVIPKEDEVLLASKIKLLISDINLRNKLATNFNKHILDNYSEQKIIYKLLKIYNS